MAYEYIDKFKKMGFGLFSHFGLYSIVGRGEWYFSAYKPNREEYESLTRQFNIKKNWAHSLVATAKRAGCRYITLTTRHHDGFSLFDTKGLNAFDAPHSACGRDLIREFADECHAAGIVPFFYHTLLDWHNPDYEQNFPKYIDYLADSIELLSTNYGEVGGFWFDGFWDKPDADWQFDRIYGIIRKYQPDAMIINNTGLNEQGKVGHREIDSVTFERGKPCAFESDRPRAGEMCQGITDHWGYAKADICAKSTPELIETLIKCRFNNCNLLLNTGLRGDGSVNPPEKYLLENVGKWLKANGDFLFDLSPAEDVSAENAQLFTDGSYYYAVICGVPMCFNSNVTRMEGVKMVSVKTDKTVSDAHWLDNGECIRLESDHRSFVSWPFDYGTSMGVRVAKFKLV